MMTRIVLIVALLIAQSGAAMARTVEERLIAGLKDQGYTILEDGYTFLGRLRIVAENDTFHREIVVNPGTGEVLRDYAVMLDDLPKAQVAQSGQSNTSGGGSGGAAAMASAVGRVNTDAGATALTAMAADAQSTGTPAQPGVTDAMTQGQTDLLLADPVTSLKPDAP